MTDGICPFADQIKNRNLLEGWQLGYADRVGFCDHTAGGFYGTMERVSFWNDPNGDGEHSDKDSVHFAIARDGRILQVLNIFDTAWAQGRLNGPSWPPYATMSQRNPNEYLISTEHEDVETVNGATRYIPGSEWTAAQYASDLRVKRWCVEEVKRVAGLNLLRFGIDSLAGHHMFDRVNRAECPGRFWRNVYQAQLYADLVQLPTQEDLMIRMNAIARPQPPYQPWEGQTIGTLPTAAVPAPTPGQVTLNAWLDYGLGDIKPKRVLVDAWIDTGYLDVLDGDGRFAGSVGGKSAAANRAVIEVILGPAGELGLRGAGTIHLMGMVGYIP